MPRAAILNDAARCAARRAARRAPPCESHVLLDTPTCLPAHACGLLDTTAHSVTGKVAARRGAAADCNLPLQVRGPARAPCTALTRALLACRADRPGPTTMLRGRCGSRAQAAKPPDCWASCYKLVPELVRNDCEVYRRESPGHERAWQVRLLKSACTAFPVQTMCCTPFFFGTPVLSMLIYSQCQRGSK